jgi:hypothetical protein
LDNMLRLICHAITPTKLVQSVTCYSTLNEDGQLWIRYHVDAPVDCLVLSSNESTQRVDDLWKTTCFEVFILYGDGTEYIELNFASSGQWAAYTFSDYRNKTGNLALASHPDIGIDFGDEYFALEAIVDLPKPIARSILSMGLSVVIEELSGQVSYWALSHAPDKPDFHHRDCFIANPKAGDAS